MWSEKTRLSVRGRRPRTGSLVFSDHISVGMMVYARLYRLHSQYANTVNTDFRILLLCIMNISQSKSERYFRMSSTIFASLTRLTSFTRFTRFKSFPSPSLGRFSSIFLPESETLPLSLAWFQLTSFCFFSKQPLKNLTFSGSVDYPDVVSIWNTDPNAPLSSVQKTCLGQYSKMPGKYSRGKPVYRNKDRENRFFFIMVFHLLSATLRWKANSIHVFSGFSSWAWTASGTPAIPTDQALADILLQPGKTELGRHGVHTWGHKVSSLKVWILKIWALSLWSFLFSGGKHWHGRGRWRLH